MGVKFKRGDRVMLTDARWAAMSNGSRVPGRRGGRVVKVYTHHYEDDGGRVTYTSASVRWDGVKQNSYANVNWLCPDDPSKHQTRDQVRALRVQKTRSAFDSWLHENPDKSAAREDFIAWMRAPHHKSFEPNEFDDTWDAFRDGHAQATREARR